MLQAAACLNRKLSGFVFHTERYGSSTHCFRVACTVCILSHGTLINTLTKKLSCCQDFHVRRWEFPGKCWPSLKNGFESLCERYTVSLYKKSIIENRKRFFHCAQTRIGSSFESRHCVRFRPWNFRTLHFKAWATVSYELNRERI